MIKLGDRVKDSITGFTGVAVSRTEYLYGCIHISVEGESHKDGQIAEVVFDEQRLTDAPAATSGGPGAIPPARSAPRR